MSDKELTKIKIGNDQYIIIDEEARKNIETLKNNAIEQNSKILSLASGSPLKASSISEMTDTTKTYINITDGKWYYHNGSTWVVGGIYQATEINNDSITLDHLSYEFKERTNNYLDTSLVQEGYTIRITATSTINSPGNEKAEFNLYPAIAVKPGERYKALNNEGKGQTINTIAFYDETGLYNSNSSVLAEDEIIIPENIYYIRFASKYTNVITQIKRSDISTYTPTYEPYRVQSKIVLKKDLEIEKKLKKFETDFNLNINDLLNKSGKTPIITWIDDDCVIEGIEKVKNICDSLGIKATLACVTSGISSINAEIENAGLNNAELKNRLLEYQNEGFHITTHSNHHAKIWKTTDSLYNVSECEKDLIKSLKMMNENGFLDNDFFVAPFGTHNTDIKKIVEKWCKCLINAGTGVNHLYENGRYNINRIFITSENDLSYYTNYIDEAYEKGDWIIFGTHSGTESEFSEALVTQVLQYAINKGIDIKTLNHAWKQRKYIYDIYEILQ